MTACSSYWSKVLSLKKRVPEFASASPVIVVIPERAGQAKRGTPKTAWFEVSRGSLRRA
jgi:hypothetical protein